MAKKIELRLSIDPALLAAKLLIGVLCLVAVVISAGGWPWLRGIDGTTWAAWVQAIGSIGAIVGAFALVNVQSKRQQTDSAVARLEAQRESGQMIMVLIASASSCMGALIVALSKEDYSAWDIPKIESLCNELDGYERLTAAHLHQALPPQFLSSVVMVGAKIRFFDSDVSELLRLKGLGHLHLTEHKRWLGQMHDSTVMLGKVNSNFDNEFAKIDRGIKRARSGD